MSKDAGNQGTSSASSEDHRHERCVLVMQALLWSTAGAVRVDNLVHSDWLAVPQTLGVLSLAFVFQNIVPVVCSRLEVFTSSLTLLAFFLFIESSAYGQKAGCLLHAQCLHHCIPSRATLSK